MSEYIVVWTINLQAENPVEAAKEALKIHRDPGSTATNFEVTPVFKGCAIYEDTEWVDLEELG